MTRPIVWSVAMLFFASQLGWFLHIFSLTEYGIPSLLVLRILTLGFICTSIIALTHLWGSK